MLEEIRGRYGAEPSSDMSYDCDKCDDTTYIFDHELGKVTGRCDCYTKRVAKEHELWQIRQVMELNNLAGKHIDLKATRPHPLSSGAIPQGVWLHGKAGNGKTHIAAWVVAKRINESPRPFKWIWTPIKPLLTAWSDRYAPEKDIREEAHETIRKLRGCELVALDDIDKIGTITSAREEAFFELLDDLYCRGAYLIVTSQSNILDFCKRMPHESAFIQRDGQGPQQRRLEAICKQIPI